MRVITIRGASCATACDEAGCPGQQVAMTTSIAFTDEFMAGGRCSQCAYPTLDRLLRCPECGGSIVEASFGPGGTVFSSTTIHIAVPGRRPPYTLAYVDLDEGPRILVDVVAGQGVPLRPGQRVRLSGVTDRGDPVVVVDPSSP
jgi:uncharacterized OB-fold protein